MSVSPVCHEGTSTEACGDGLTSGGCGSTETIRSESADAPTGSDLQHTLSRHLQHGLAELDGPPRGEHQLEGGTALPAACRRTRYRRVHGQTSHTRAHAPLTSGLGGHAAFDVVGPQHRLLDLTALQQVEGHHEGLQPVAAFGQEDHLRGSTVT